MLRLHVPGGSGDWSLCTGRQRSEPQRSHRSGGVQERPRQEDGAAGGGAAAAPGTPSPHLAHHSTAEQPAASGEWKRQSGPGRGASRGEFDGGGGGGTDIDLGTFQVGKPDPGDES